jgi:hypothetical protein
LALASIHGEPLGATERLAMTCRAGGLALALFRR